MPRVAYTISKACETYGVGRSSLYLLLKSGKVRAVKHGKRTLVLDRDLRRWFNSLPAMQTDASKPNPKRRKPGEAQLAA